MATKVIEHTEEFILENNNSARPDTANTVGIGGKSKKEVELMPIEKESKQEGKLPKESLKKKSAPGISALNRYAQYDKYHPLNQPFPAIEDFKGPKGSLFLKKAQRKSTDLIGLLFPCVFFIALVVHCVFCNMEMTARLFIWMADSAHETSRLQS